MSWESTAVYYRRINESVRERLGGLHSAKLIMHSVDFESIVELRKMGAAVASAGRRRPLLLATRYTMELDFYLMQLRQRPGLWPMVPNETDRNAVHDIIFNELCCGVIRESSRQRYRDIVARAVASGPTASFSVARKSACW